jgi:hypothetical protein
MKQISVLFSILLVIWGCKNEVEVSPEAPRVQFLVSPQHIYQESKSDTISISVILSKPSTQNEKIDFSFNGSAILGQDYQLITPTPLIIKAGDLRGEIKLKIIKDLVFESGTENVTVTFKTLGSNLQVGTNNSFEFGIYDAKALVGFELATLDIHEANNIKVKVKLEKPINEDVVLYLASSSTNPYYRLHTNHEKVVIAAGSTETFVSVDLLDTRPTTGQNLLLSLKITEIKNDDIMIASGLGSLLIKAIDTNWGLQLFVDWNNNTDIDYEIVDSNGNSSDFGIAKGGFVTVQNLQNNGTYYLKLKVNGNLLDKTTMAIIAKNNTNDIVSVVGNYKFNFLKIEDSMALRIDKQGLNYTIIPRDISIVSPVGIG